MPYMCIDKYNLLPMDFLGLMKYLGSISAHRVGMRSEFDSSCYKYASLWKRMCAEHRFLSKHEAWLGKYFGFMY